MMCIRRIRPTERAIWNPPASSSWPPNKSSTPPRWHCCRTTRRSLKKSTYFCPRSAARCSPILGSDFAQDDNADGTWIQPPSFNVTLLGQKKILAMVHGEKSSFYDDKKWDKNGIAQWPSPAVGKWELRDEYIIDITPLPKLGSYCYGHKVM